MKAWLVCTITKEAMTNINQSMPISWATGMIGAMPVFRYKKDAKKYNKGKVSEVIEIEIPESEE